MYSVAMRNNGQPAVLGMVNQVAGSNATQIAEDVKTALADAQKQMPPGMKVTIEQDVTEFLFASIAEVIRTLVITLVLVFFVVYIFLQDFRSTVIPMIASTSGIDWNLLLPMGVRILHQPFNPVSIVISDCHCGR